MRILMISDVYFPRVTGVSTSIQTFARAFAERGHAVTLIAPDYRQASELKSEPEPESEPFEVIRIPSRYLPLDPEDRILKPLLLRRHRHAFARAAFDILHIHTPFIAHYAGLRLARRLDIPVVESYHTFFEQYLHHYVPFLPSSWLRRAARYFSVTQCNAADAIAVPSRPMLEILKQYGVHATAEVIPTGIPLDHLTPGTGERFRRTHGIQATRPLLIHVSRLAFEKNIDFILRVLVRVRAQLADVLLVLAGEGPARQELEREVARLGLRDNVLFTGYLSRNGELQDCYCAGSAFVFASRTETQGLVLLEAMALGVPVVSTAVMGTKEVLGDGQGALIAAEDESEFAAHTIRLLSEPALRERLAREAREHAREWSAPALAERMLALYQQTIQRHTATRKNPQRQTPTD